MQYSATTKLTLAQYKELKEYSKQTGIPCSKILRDSIRNTINQKTALRQFLKKMGVEDERRFQGESKESI